MMILKISVILLLLSSLAVAAALCPDSGPVKHSTLLLSFLQRLQATALQTFGPTNFDPKLYVDLPLKFDLPTTEAAFYKLPRTANGSVLVKDLEVFIGKYFGVVGSDLVTVEPADFVPVPENFLPKVESPEVRAWALEVHSVWRNLSRKVSNVVCQKRDLHTLLPLPDLVVIPGSRFREIYYWDSYWTIRGLLASKMYKTAKAIASNLISLIEEYGFVLNGARSYYTNRSQPPLLSAMILEIYKSTGDLALVRRALPSLVREHHFWNSGIHKVKIQDVQGVNHAMSRYCAMWNKPRPESATFDEKSASKLSNDSQKKHFYRQVASTAESGWDFSTRWMRNSSDLTSLSTTSVIPVDLNVYILKSLEGLGPSARWGSEVTEVLAVIVPARKILNFKMELDIAFFARIIGEKAIAKTFSTASKARHASINSIFWNSKANQWLDYWLVDSSTCEETHRWEGHNQNQKKFASNFIPLWIELFNSDSTLVKKVMKGFRSSGLLHAAGIATSLSNSGKQWDFPNGWAPLQHMIVEGLVKSGIPEAYKLAEDIAIRWITTNYASYKSTGAMHEKYDVEYCGKTGGGGEYIVQTGFGWSNGVVLAFLQEFGWPRDRKIDCLSTSKVPRA